MVRVAARQSIHLRKGGITMDINTLYSVKITGYNDIFKESVRIYRDAVDFLIPVCIDHWNDIISVDGVCQRKMYIEHLVHKTKNYPHPLYPFDKKFYKFPSYLLRGAIAEALGKVSSYISNLTNWKAMDPSTRGRRPGIPKAGHIYPCLYRDNTFIRTDTYEAKIKVFIRNTWDWIIVKLRKSDVDYIIHHCSDRKECAPVLQKRGKQWYLDFCFKEKVTLKDTDIFNQTIVAVDLGINNACTCTVMRSDGTVLGRYFYKVPKEYDCLKRKTGHIKRAQHHGSRCVKNLWRYANGVNHDISVKTASFIEGIAREFDADAVVFEHLNTSGRKHGSKKQKLTLWRKNEVQRMVADKVHRLGIHISHICAWGTSRLAYDGSGTVLRGNKSQKTNGSYSVCEFTNGRVYNCDLNASYNIGSRYFVREILKSLPATERQHIQAKVPGCAKRSTCTLSTLINLNSALYA